MAVDIVPVRPEHAPEMARICYEAFGALHDRHNTPRDFDSQETAAMVMGLITGSPSFHGFAAIDSGRLVGSNFLCTADAVAGVGPITVDPACQSRGVGRALMQAVLDLARERKVEHVRLNQEAINTTSLSLYTKLGFEWRDSVAVIEATNAGADHRGVRPLTEADLPAVEAISTRVYGHSRRNDTAMALGWQFPAFGLERDGKLCAYIVPGFFGHGCAPNQADMAALIAHAVKNSPPPFHRILVPLSQGGLYRDLLGRGCPTLKVLSYMTVGPYRPANGVWLPSILN